MAASRADIKDALRGKEVAVLNALGIGWSQSKRDHIKCPFPNHDDRNPSWRWDDTNAKYFCTCSQGSIIDAVIAMRGGDFAEASKWCRDQVGLEQEGQRGGPLVAANFHHSKHGQPSRWWVYRDSIGKIVGAAVRYETPKGKQVIPWTPDGRGRWVAKALPTPRPLYRLPELLASGGKPVLITEGEKAADRAAELFHGHAVTTSVGGCKAWKQTDWAPLAGRKIVIWPDNDDEGRLYAQNVAAAVDNAEITIVQLDDRWPLKWDLADDLPPAFRAEDLAQKVATAPAYVRPTSSDDAFDLDVFGKPKKNESNVKKAMTRLGIAVRYDSFAERYEIQGLEGYGPQLNDHGLDELYLMMAREYDLKPTKQDFDRIVMAAARRARFHPVKEYFERLVWDGNDRIDEWLSTYAGAEDDAYTRGVGRIVLVAAVRRIYEPGCKFDEMMIWEGEQGTLKSTGVGTLCPNPEWLCESLSLSADEKAVIEQTTGKLIIEIGELSGYRKREIEHIKEFLSRCVDSARPAYGRMRVDRPRQFIFIGTTNETNYLMDDTGDRRFWPVRVANVDVDSLARDRDQLWAEAVYYAKKGESIRLAVNLRQAAREQQDKRAQEDEWQEIVAVWLSERANTLDPDGARTTITDVGKMALGIEAAKLEPIVQKRLMRCLKKAGWQKAERSNGRNFWRPESSAVQ